jgi:cystathionine gamma-synthase/methionine-gamma-lyase
MRSLEDKLADVEGGQRAAERARRGIADSMIRLSVGLEDTDDLIVDLAYALNTT